MKRPLSLIVLFVAFVSCSSDNKVFTDSVEDQTTHQVDSGQVDQQLNEIEEIPQIDPIDFPIENFPEVWIRLTRETDGEDFYIQHYCEAELPQIWIEKDKKNQWKLTALYGQDSEVWKIKNFEAVQREMELYMVVIGSMDLEPEYSLGEAKKVNFCWNQDMQHCTFDNIYSGENIFFVNEEDRANYPEVYEDCEGLWE